MKIAAVLLLGMAVAIAWGWRRTEPVEIWDEPLTGTRFRKFEPREFVMGSPPEEVRRDAHEALRRVRLAGAYYVAETEVTQAQWARVMGENPSFFSRCGPDCPVERVSWLDVQRFLNRLNARTAGSFRLPTEGEWEYACRGISTLPFGSFRGLSSAFANVNGVYPYNAPKGPHRRTTTPVRRFPPNWAGLYDIAGNVWEWTQDEYCPVNAGGGPGESPSCESARRVLKGGSWAFDAGSARCAARYARFAQDASADAGFRLARDAF